MARCHRSAPTHRRPASPSEQLVCSTEELDESASDNAPDVESSPAADDGDDVDEIQPPADDYTPMTDGDRRWYVGSIVWLGSPASKPRLCSSGDERPVKMARVQCDYVQICFIYDDQPQDRTWLTTK